MKIYWFPINQNVKINWIENFFKLNNNLQEINPISKINFIFTNDIYKIWEEI